MKKGLKFLIAVLVIIIIALVGFILWDKFINNKKDKNYNERVGNSSIENKIETPSRLMVNREGMEEEVESKEYSSKYGYTIRYATDYFKVSNHDDQDYFERDEDINCVVLKKENISYSEKVKTLSSYKETTVNGYEAVYTTRKTEGQSETTYYINTKKDYIYEIITSCQDSTEYLEGLGHIMDAMVQTFAIK